jgi:hypothetical protein
VHTTLNMDGNDIINATRIADTELLEMTGARARISNDSGELSLLSNGNMFLTAETNSIVVAGNNPGDIPRFTSPAQTIQMGSLDNDLAVGDLSTNSQNGSNVTIATGDTLTGNLYGDEARVNSINSLHKRDWDPLRLQDFARGEVIIGQRGRYVPPQGLAAGSSTYELSDGQLTAGIIKTQDITCADCGGNLSDILPRWRHMGTYFVPETGATVPKPNCSISRRDEINRGALGDEQNVSNSTTDNRYQAKVLILPKHIAKQNYTGTQGEIGFNVEFRAEDINATQWMIHMDHPNDDTNAEGFAMTYCVFIGGHAAKLDPSNPGNTVYSTRQSSSGGTWTVLP